MQIAEAAIPLCGIPCRKRRARLGRSGSADGIYGKKRRHGRRACIFRHGLRAAHPKRPRSTREVEASCNKATLKAGRHCQAEISARFPRSRKAKRIRLQFRTTLSLIGKLVLALKWAISI